MTTLHRASRWTALAAAAFVVAMPGVVTAQSASGLPSSSTAPAAPASLDGTWTVDPSIGSFDYDANDFSGSWVGYRAKEELVGIGGADAVGRTPDVTGSITLSGTTLTAADLVADLTTLRSDQSMRDGQLGRQGVQTDQFPTATFVLTQPIDLGTLPAEAESISITAVGDLTIHGVTKNVSIPLGAVRQGDIIGVAGSLTFTWGDFGMEQPTSMRVVSLANDVTMELRGSSATTPRQRPAPQRLPQALLQPEPTLVVEGCVPIPFLAGCAAGYPPKWTTREAPGRGPLAGEGEYRDLARWTIRRFAGIRASGGKHDLLGCLLAFGIALAPRAFLILAWIFSARWPIVWGGDFLVPLLGIIFLPFTTVMYMLAWSPKGIEGWDWLWILLGLFLDITHYIQMANNRKEVPGYTGPYLITDRSRHGGAPHRGAPSP